MKRCPNCGRDTERTSDWACEWCGYPLLSGSYKMINKTFRELQEERRSSVKRVEKKFEPEAEQVERVQPEPRPVPPKPAHKPAQPPQPVYQPVDNPEPAAAAPQPSPRVEPRQTIITPPPLPEALPTPPHVVSLQPPEPGPAIIVPPPAPQPAQQSAEIQQPAEQAPAPAQQAPQAPPLPQPVQQAPPPPAPQPEASKYSADTDPMMLKSEYSIEDLFGLLQLYGKAADEKLTSRTFKVSGIVYRTVVNPDMDIRYLILTSQKKYKEWQITCTFDKVHEQKLRHLRVGETAMVLGKYDGYGAAILMRDCLLAG